MKTHDYIAGIWNGLFIYGSEEDESESVRFRMELTIKNGIIAGQCIDSEEDGGIPLPANINGFVENNTVSFIKKYPCLIYVDENGKYQKDESQSHPEIHYYGEYINGMLIGSWEMILGSVEQGDDIIVEQLFGKWEMRKKE